MLINLRNALMTGKRLPYDAEVEYIGNRGSTSYNYIKTGIFATNATKVSTTSKGSGWVFGSRKSAGNSALGVFKSASATTYVYGSDSVPVSGNITTAINTIEISESGAYLDGNLVASFTSGQTFSSSPYEIYIFNINNGGNVGNNLSGEIYSCKIWQNSVLVRDYIPVRKGDVGYLYDRVSGKLFGNAGTGDFVLGPDVVPVEYIESSGTQYIDTGVIGNSSTKVELKAQGTNTSAFQTLLGCRDSNGIYSFAVWQRALLNSAYGMRWDYLTTNTGTGSGYVLDGGWNTSQPNLVIKDGANNYLNGVQLRANASNSFSCNFPLALFAMNTGGSKGNFFVGKMFMCKISNNNTPTRNYTPVRVGTDATSWEGAMMDVLTRRIYRNAGTGAFTYGNDLKYPIPAE